MDSRFEVTWDGPVPGLAEHRISIDAFGESLTLLLGALRRIASNMFRDAIEEGPATRGPFKKGTGFLDLEIFEIKQASSGFGALCVLHAPPGETSILVEDLTQRAGDALLSAIEQEAQGSPTEASVRKYLKSLPDGITGQRYDFQSNGRKRSVVIGEMDLREASKPLAYLVSITGFVVAAGFEPGTTSVTIKDERRTLTLGATDEQTEAALRLRGERVVAMAVSADRMRLLNLRRADEEPPPLAETETERVLFGKWDNLLRKLAQ